MSLNDDEWQKLRDMINAWPDDGDRILMHRVINREREREAQGLAPLDLARRKSLHARMAGNIASGVIQHGLSKDRISPVERQNAADLAVDLAERILRKVGL